MFRCLKWFPARFKYGLTTIHISIQVNDQEFQNWTVLVYRVNLLKIKKFCLYLEKFCCLTLFLDFPWKIIMQYECWIALVHKKMEKSKSHDIFLDKENFSKWKYRISYQLPGQRKLKSRKNIHSFSKTYNPLSIPDTKIGFTIRTRIVLSLEICFLGLKYGLPPTL